MTKKIPLPDAAKRLSISWERAWLALLKWPLGLMHICSNSSTSMFYYINVNCSHQKCKPTWAGGQK